LFVYGKFITISFFDYIAKQKNIMENEQSEIEKYADKYSDDDLWQKVSSIASKTGGKLIYIVLLLYYALQSSTISAKDKTIIIGALGYFILPVDLVPDFIAGLGYTDDLATLIYVAKTIYVNITPEVKQKAIQATQKLIPNFSNDSVDEI